MNAIDVQVILYPNPDKAPPQWDASPQAATTAIEWLFEWDRAGPYSRKPLTMVHGRTDNTVAQLCAREKCSVRQVNMTISLAFLAPNLIKAAVEGRLPRGIGIERLRDPPTEWGRQFDALGLNPE
jgi:hypothetical protein